MGRASTRLHRGLPGKGRPEIGSSGGAALDTALPNRGCPVRGTRWPRPGTGSWPPSRSTGRRSGSRSWPPGGGHGSGGSPPTGST